jgi:hypothetical protein
MKIEYTYEIINVDQAARCMEVVYSSEGRQTMHSSTRLPFEGESLDSVIKSFAPIGLWVEMETPVVAPEVGARGSFEVYVPTADEADAPLMANEVEL